ncbi:radial spoke head protein 9 homolog isoform X2 [Octopus bimaculoides]|uniref:Radial spoke head protein 9 homolog n=1 Tax=Octopus bimaculoides TaxID=37653 RepID=A0A0L8FUZ2_OCTBM|nr:radial spoke head protein 9 homolog isoform X2 [Octopus bimaculoides]|eukprot:XP_014786874.1 PREDICTED: radial spoke head protein 9 homolog isoform X2 [Octopus bimaculoides]
MDSENLILDINFFASSGIILSPEQKSSLQSSLTILKYENKFHKVYFWGKIKTLRGKAYFIAQGVSQDEFSPLKKYFYCMDCVHWVVMPSVESETMKLSRNVRGRFTGDVSNEFKLKKDGVDEEEEEHEEMVKEEDRLASVVLDIDDDVRIVPRGSFMYTPTGKVVLNPSFKGLFANDASKLYSYMHFRPAVLLSKKPIIERSNMDRSLDFMDIIEDDIPKGCWSFQFERGCGMVVIRSLLWPGYTFFTKPGTPKFGSLYFGTGEKNLDLPFML